MPVRPSYSVNKYVFLIEQSVQILRGHAAEMSNALQNRPKPIMFMDVKKKTVNYIDIRISLFNKF